jgi:hypothetical protein
MAVDVVGFTARYEDWLGSRIPLVRADLHAKHEQMRASPVRFLRGTYYLWLRRLADLLPEVIQRPAVPIVGDLHIENFGTWRDRDGLHRWGVNDLDELAQGSYALDLVRLGTSAALTPDVSLPVKHLCHLVLDQWQTATPGPATRIDDADAGHLRALVPVPEKARAYFAALGNGPMADAAIVPPQVRTAVSNTVAGDWQPSWHTRRAGTGSLGHPRLVALGRDATGDWQAREVKLLGPGTIDWLAQIDPTVAWPVTQPDLYPRVMAALHGGHPAARLEGWQLRRLAPDVARISLAGLATRDAQRVARSMAQAVVDVHGTQPDALTAARADHAGRDPGWLGDAVKVMLADTRTCYRRWSQRR